MRSGRANSRACTPISLGPDCEAVSDTHTLLCVLEKDLYAVGDAVLELSLGAGAVDARGRLGRVTSQEVALSTCQLLATMKAKTKS